MTTPYLHGQELINSIRTVPYSRDLIGCHGQIPDAAWPNQTRIAVQFVLNYEEGGENHIEHGDAGSEQFLSKIFGAVSFPDKQMSMDSMYEYDSRAGFWRIHEEFQHRQLPISIFGMGNAGTLSTYGCGYGTSAYGSSHKYLKKLYLATHLSVGIPDKIALKHDLLAEFPQIQYDSDYDADDLPFWTTSTNTIGERCPHLIIPYTLDSNDMKFSAANGFSTCQQFFQDLKDSFAVLYTEGEHRPKMLSMGMHCRLLGRLRHFKAGQKILDYIQSHEQVGICGRDDIAQHRYQQHPPTT